MTFLPARNLLQAPGSVVTIRPHGFRPNPATRAMTVHLSEDDGGSVRCMIAGAHLATRPSPASGEMK